MKVTGKLTDLIKRRAVMRSFDGLYAEVKETLALDNRALASMVTGFIALAIIVSIGVVILSSVDTAMPTLDSSSAYYNLSTTVSTTTVSG